MKVIHLIPCLSGGGAEQQLQYLYCSESMCDFQVHVVYLNDVGIDTSDFKNVQFHKLVTRSNYNPLLIWQLFVLVRKIKPDIVQSWLIQSDILAAIVCLLTNTTWICRESNSPALRSGRVLKFYLRRIFLRFSSIIISNSTGGYNYWNEKYPEKRNLLVENGFPVEEIKFEGLKSDNIPLQLKDSAYVLFVGRLENQKNIPKLIESMIFVKSGIKLVICGEGSQCAALKELTEVSRLSEKVIFNGKTGKAEVYQLMTRARGVVLTSHFEGFPNVAVEAMICRAPLVLSDIEPHRSLLSDNEAVFVNKESPREIAAAIDGLVQDPDSAARRAGFAHQKAVNLSLEAMASKYRQIYVEATV